LSFCPDSALSRQVNTSSIHLPKRLESEEKSVAMLVDLLLPNMYQSQGVRLGPVQTSRGEPVEIAIKYYSRKKKKKRRKKKNS
jgi:hypothetical protein